MTVINKNDLLLSIEQALQYISYYHPADFIEHLHAAYVREQSPAARDAMGQVLASSRMSALGKRPLCQDTGIVNVFMDVGMELRWAGFEQGLDEVVNEAVRRAYAHAENPLRASVVQDPLFARHNTRDNTPAVIHTRMVPGNTLKVDIAAKGGGSENKAQLVMMNPRDDLVAWVLETLPKLGAGWCPPGVLGIGVGGTAEKAVLMAKESLLEPLSMLALLEKKAQHPECLTALEQLRLELYEKINALGIGAQGLGGQTTVLDVKIHTYPTHAASKPVALIPNCTANRHIRFELDGSGPAHFEPPRLEDWPAVGWAPAAESRRVNLETLDKEEIRQWQPGETLLLSGRILTGRDAAHARLQQMIERAEPLPVDFTNRVIYYVGPVDAVGAEVVGPAGPTTATRMDPYTEMMLANTGLLAMIGKAERGKEAIEAIRKHQSVYLIAVGGAAFLVSQAIRSARLVAFEDLGMEAIYEFEVVDMPVTVAVSSDGQSIHQLGPAQWLRPVEA